MIYQLCDSRQALDRFLTDVEGSSRIALDFEGESNLHRYGIHLCLAQVALETGEIFLIDPRALGDDFAALEPLFSNPTVTKVMFSPDFDVRLLHHAAGIELKGIYDLQLAAKWIGFDRTGLDSILSALGLTDGDGTKSDQTSDWTRRPLTRSQLDYAAGDVTHLLAAHDALGNQLDATGRNAEFREEMHKLEALRFQLGVLSHGFRKKLRSLSPHLVELAESLYWERERIAEKLDVPPFKILSNDLLVYLAKSRPRGEGSWAKLKGIHPRARRLLGPLRDLVEAYRSVRR